MTLENKQVEVRITDPTTGGQKGSKLARFDLIPMDALWEVAEVYGRGALKYADRNWEKGYKWGLSIAAMQRHLTQRLSGEIYDAETGARHLACVVWHALALLTFEIRGLGTDDISTRQRTPVQTVLPGQPGQCIVLNPTGQARYVPAETAKEVNGFRAGTTSPVEDLTPDARYEGYREPYSHGTRERD